MGKLKFDVPGVTLSTLDSGLEILSVANKFASARISTNGAHIISYVPAGEKDLLWVSKKSHMTPGKPIRGGVPVCWPWFGSSDKQGWPGHGFARLETWEIAEVSSLDSGATRVVLKLDSAMREFPMSEFPFTLHMIFTVGSTLEMTLVMVNKSDKPVTVGCALHTYFAVSDARKIAVSGLDGVGYFDYRVSSTKFDGNVQKGDLKIAEEVDYVYFPAPGATEIVDPGWGRIVKIEKSGSESTVVWNPWIEKSKVMPDYGDEEYPEMVCVECANAKCDQRVLQPGIPNILTQKLSLR